MPALTDQANQCGLLRCVIILGECKQKVLQGPTHAILELFLKDETVEMCPTEHETPRETRISPHHRFSLSRLKSTGKRQHQGDAGSGTWRARCRSMLRMAPTRRNTFSHSNTDTEDHQHMHSSTIPRSGARRHTVAHCLSLESSSCVSNHQLTSCGTVANQANESVSRQSSSSLTISESRWKVRELRFCAEWALKYTFGKCNKYVHTVVRS
jgi:hypothetical protein